MVKSYVLMLHDCAFVGQQLKDYINSFYSDSFNVEQMFYFNEMGFSLKKGFNLSKMFLRSLFSSYDLIHVHYLGSASVMAYLSGKPYVVHVHGSDVRNKKLSFIQKKVLNKAEVILYSTNDLKRFLPVNAIQLKTPVGSEFVDLDLVRTIEFLGREKYRDNIKERFSCVDVTFFDGISFDSMPYLLNLAINFVDGSCIDGCINKTMLEAYACGCNVIDCNGVSVYIDLTGHFISDVAEDLVSLYELILE